MSDLATLRRRSLSTPGGEPSTRSLLLTVLGEYVLPADVPVWSTALVAGLGALGVQEKTARQAIARSSADGWLDRERVGRQVRWRLTDPTRALLRDGAERIYGFTGGRSSWDGRWLLVRLSLPEDQREHRHHAATRLAWTGFASLGQGLWVSPHADRREELLHALEIAEGVEAPMVFVTEPQGQAQDEALVAAAWGDRAVLAAEYAGFIEAVTSHSGDLEGEAAFLAQTWLVHGWRKFPFMDPGLPLELVPEDWIGRRAAALFADRHRRWAGPARRWFAERNADGRGDG